MTSPSSPSPPSSPSSSPSSPNGSSQGTKDQTQDWTRDWTQNRPQTRILIQSAVASMMIVSLTLIGFGWEQHWLVHPKKPDVQDESRFVEAEMIQIPEEAHLVEKKSTPPAAKAEVTLSKTPGKGKPNSEPPSQLDERNQTQDGPPPVAPTHGVIVIYSPPPVLPSYLETQDIKSSVLIDFYVNHEGVAQAKLVGPSGREELDAIALNTVKKWQFKPAEKEGHPIDSKVRLRIVFEVK